MPQFMKYKREYSYSTEEEYVDLEEIIDVTADFSRFTLKSEPSAYRKIMSGDPAIKILKTWVLKNMYKDEDGASLQ